ncbi:unnamed protein product [Periconia digitata]|uniref:Uncharacterized protein n=1 Tax=Periconia digitata TaxID=1303443 RepID=A0A9W4XTQ2_9PLEO|nr:unnamed protein product [Periconia digitata]
MDIESGSKKEKTPELTGSDTDPFTVDKSLEKGLIWKQDVRIIPPAATISLLCYLARTNIGMLPLSSPSGIPALVTEGGS